MPKAKPNSGDEDARLLAHYQALLAAAREQREHQDAAFDAAVGPRPELMPIHVALTHGEARALVWAAEHVETMTSALGIAHGKLVSAIERGEPDSGLDRAEGEGRR